MQFSQAILSLEEGTMSQQETKTEEQLSDEQLQGVSGGLTQRFEDAREENLDKSVKPDEELSEDQLKGVAGGLNERFEQSLEENLDKR